MTRRNLKTLAFQPRAGTKAHLAIWHLVNNRPGAHLSAEELAIVMGCCPKGVVSNLRAAVAAGVITRHPGRNHRQRCWLYAIHPQWTLTTPPPDHATHPPTSPGAATTKRTRPTAAPDDDPGADDAKDPWPRQRCISTSGQIRMERLGTKRQVFDDSAKQAAQTQEQQA